MAIFLFDILGATGHVKPTLRLAVILKEQGHEVFYTHTSRSIFSSYLAQNGIGTVLYPDDLRTCFPDLVLLDQVLRDRADFYEYLRIPFIYVESALSGLKRQGVPPLDSGFIPTNSRFSDFICDLLWALKSRKNITTSVKQLVLAATPLDYPGEVNLLVENVGPFWCEVKNVYTPPRQRQSLYSFLDKRKVEGKIILYCSLDTYQGFSDSLKVRHFYKILRPLCERHSEYELVVSINGKIHALDLMPLPRNMRIFKWMNQSEVLRYCDLVITHGGMNILMECVLAGVPMLVYPQAIHFDQCGNAARIVYHKLGARGNMRNVTVNSMYEKIQQIIDDKRSISKRLIEMKELFIRKNASMDQAVDSLLCYCENLKNR